MKALLALLLSAVLAWFVLAWLRAEPSRAQAPPAAARPWLHPLAPAPLAAGTRTRPWTPSYRPSSPSSPPAQHAWVMTPGHQGWRRRDGSSETTVGSYERPAAPAAGPQNQVYHHEGRGAVGLSLSLKLGRKTGS